MPPPYSHPGLLNFSELAETRIRQIIHISEEFWDESYSGVCLFVCLFGTTRAFHIPGPVFGPGYPGPVLNNGPGGVPQAQDFAQKQLGLGGVQMGLGAH